MSMESESWGLHGEQGDIRNRHGVVKACSASLFREELAWVDRGGLRRSRFSVSWGTSREQAEMHMEQEAQRFRVWNVRE